MVPDDTLSAELRRGLEVLRRRHYPDACVVAVDGNFALVDLGEAPVPDAYLEASARVFARVPLDIVNAEPYGILTVPPLHRRDGVVLPHQHIGHPNAQPLVNAGFPEASFWSWNWAGLGRRGPDDIALVFEWAGRCLRDGVQ